MSKCEGCLYWPKCEEYPFDESGCDDYKDRSRFVEVVLCSECAKRYVPYECGLWHGRLNDTHYFGEWGDEFWCAKGERRSDG